MSPSVQRDLIEVLASEFAARQRRGECPAIDEYVARHPEREDDIRALLPTIAALEKMKVDQQRMPDGKVTLAGKRLQQLGDFRLIREIGRGGMGIVYEAEQQSLSRRVAVKVLPRQSLVDAEQLRKFESEAKLAASLHHTNIVPVFGVGQDEGFHFYVMQLIDGVGLDRVLQRLQTKQAPWSSIDFADTVHAILNEQTDCESTVTASPPSTQRFTAQQTLDDISTASRSERPLPSVSLNDSLQLVGKTYWQHVAKIGIQIADALHYAHSSGTLHRDIKPANIVLDRQGVCWVADFGLAKAIEDNRSLSGSLAGTLAYMSPEQLRGKIDRRSDVYSLGLTLYELLTLRPAHQAADRAQLMLKIASVSPPRPRQLQAAIPRDLETIVLKSIDREASKRYATAAELADDLRRFLEDRPILARRASPSEHAWRWCRRNPVTAGLATAASLLLLLVAAVASIGYANTRAALQAEQEQRARTEAATEVAIEVLDRIYDQFSPPSPSGPSAQGVYPDEKPILSPATARVLEDLLVFYDRLAETGVTQPKYQAKVALANRRIGDIRHRLHQYDLAETAYNESIKLYRLLDANDHQVNHVVQVAGILNEMGKMAHHIGRPQLAGSYHAAAKAELEKLSSNELTNVEAAQAMLAQTDAFLNYEIEEPIEPRDRPFRGDHPPGFGPGGPMPGGPGPGRGGLGMGGPGGFGGPGPYGPPPGPPGR